MSCIYGILNLGHNLVEIEELGLMATTLNYWGADKVDFALFNNIGLGQLTLWNTPESSGEKPLSQQEGAIKIIADARIDNRDELLKKVDIGRQEPKLVSDQELIRLAYKKYGTECVKHLIGDFAFAIWDETTQQLFCARDHMGVKPFFFYVDNGRFVFASEQKGILCLSNIDRSINNDFFYQQLIVANADSHDATLYQKINRLKPAHYLFISKTSTNILQVRYWDMDTITQLNFTNRQDYYDGLLYQFEQAVKCRVRSAYPVGSELSGGLDSSAITAAANNFLQREQKQVISFSNVHSQVKSENNGELDERRYIDDVINFAGIKNSIFLSEKAFPSYLDEIDFTMWVNDGLNFHNDGWQLPARKAAAALGVRTMLSGFPGDQMVTSANKSYFLDLYHNKQYLKYFKAPQHSLAKFNKARPFLPTVLLNAARQFKHRLGYYENPVIQALSIYNIPLKSQKILDNLLLQRRENFFLKSYREGQKSILLRPAIYNRLETETRFGYYFKLEPRYPMADIRLTQYYLSMPNYIKYDDPLPRSAYRIAVKKYLPPSVFTRDDKFGSIAPFLIPQEYLNELKILIDKLPENNNFLNTSKIKDNLRQVMAQTDASAMYHTFLKHPYPSIEVLQWLKKNADDPTLGL